MIHPSYFLYLLKNTFVEIMITKRVEKVKAYLKEVGADAIIVPSNDPHFGEYIPGHNKIREWVSGFTGSAATVVVSTEGSALWTDSRYFLQAQMQLEGSGIELMKMGLPETPSVEQWIKATGSNVVAIDSSLFSVSQLNSLKLALQDIEILLLNDPFSGLWDGRPQLTFGEVSNYKESLSGKGTKEKFIELSQNFTTTENWIYITVLCDEVAWFCNIRGCDVPYNPLPLSRLIISKSDTTLFCNTSSLEEEAKSQLTKNGVAVMEYDDFYKELARRAPGSTIIAHPSKLPIDIWQTAIENGAEYIPDTTVGGYINHMKSVKNEIELNGFCRAMQEDGVAWVKLLKWLDEGINAGAELTEPLVADKFAEYRRESQFYKGESFAPIVAFGANGASPHYSINYKEPQKIGEGLLLMDTGAQYIFGTTDTTRTIFTSEPTDQQKRDYTLVLKGMISLSRAKFPKGTKGASLDILARGPVCSGGRLYRHGTGHGVGHFLCVHEGPQSIRMEDNPVALEPGMVQSNEPAVYIPGEYGIRIENLISCEPYMSTSQGDFLHFNTLTLVPISLKGVDKQLLGDENMNWLQEYNTTVYKKLSPFLDESHKSWLKSKIDGAYC